MKLFTVFSLLILMFTSCAVLTPQEIQQERLHLLEAYDEARQRHNPEKVKEVVKDLLVGKWQYVGLEVEGGNTTMKVVKPTPDQQKNSPDSFAEQVFKSAISKQKAASNAPEQGASPSSPDPEADEQTSEENARRLPRIEVTDDRSSQEILGAKAALVASTRQNLTVEFFEDRGSYYYSSNSGKNVTGQCYVTTKQYQDDIFPFIRFNQRTGTEMLEFLFGSEPVKQIAAKQKQELAAMVQNRKMGIRAARRAAAKRNTFSVASMAGITVTEDTLYLVLYGDMKLTAKGWMRTGGLRCTFKRIE